MSNRRLPNRGVRDAEEESVVVDAKVKGVAGASAGAVAGVSDHRAAQTGHAAAPETQRRWNVWAHSAVKIACRASGQCRRGRRRTGRCSFSP